MNQTPPKKDWTTKISIEEHSHGKQIREYVQKLTSQQNKNEENIQIHSVIKALVEVISE